MTLSYFKSFNIRLELYRGILRFPKTGAKIMKLLRLPLKRRALNRLNTRTCQAAQPKPRG